MIRAQAVPDKPGYAAHFRIFCLASAGRESKDHAFAIEALILEQHGYQFGARRVDVLATAQRSALADRVAKAVGGERKLLEHPYYNGGLRYMLWVTHASGEQVPLGDGGLFDWVAKLTTNARNVYVASGIGAQLVAYAFGSRVTSR